MDCMRCNGQMIIKKREYIQLGKGGGIFGSVRHSAAGVLDVVIFECNKCGRIEFFDSEAEFPEVDLLTESDYAITKDEEESAEQLVSEDSTEE